MRSSIAKPAVQLSQLAITFLVGPPWKFPGSPSERPLDHRHHRDTQVNVLGYYPFPHQAAQTLRSLVTGVPRPHVTHGARDANIPPCRRRGSYPTIDHRFRVRVAGTAPPDSLPLVLLSQVQGHPPPDWCSSAIANLVLRSFLGYSSVIPTFFELSRWVGKPRAFRVRFETIGCHLRPILVNPQYVPLNHQVLEQVFKVKPDTPNPGVP